MKFLLYLVDGDDVANDKLIYPIMIIVYQWSHNYQFKFLVCITNYTTIVNVVIDLIERNIFSSCIIAIKTNFSWNVESIRLVGNMVYLISLYVILDKL